MGYGRPRAPTVFIPFEGSARVRSLLTVLADGVWGQQDEDHTVSRQASIAELRSTLEEKLNASVAEKLDLKYEDAGKLPAAAIVCVEGIELRLEKDYFDGCWTIATNEGSPRLLDRV